MIRLRFWLAVFTLVLFGVNAYSADLIGYWDFENDFGDVSGNANNGTAMGSGVEIVYDAVMGGNVVQFDGSDPANYLLIDNESNFDFTTGVTITAWIKAGPDQTDWVNIVSKYDSYNLLKQWYADALNAGIVGKGDTVNWTSVFDDQWHFIAMTYNGSEIAAYVDQFKSVAALTGELPLNDNPLRIGGNSLASITGCLDDVRVYNYGLTENEIQTVRSEKRRMIGFWDFEDNFNDVSGNGNHGVAMGDGVELVFDSMMGGNVASFNGGDPNGFVFGNYLQVENESNFDLTKAVTITAWMKAASYQADWVNVVSKSGSFGLTKQWYANALNGGITGIGDAINWSSVFDDQWHFIAMTYDGAEVAVYVDETRSVNAITGDITLTDSPFTIGGNSAYGMTGCLDDVRVYNFSLTEDEVMAIQSEKKDAPRLVGCWEFEGNADDTSGSGNHGEILPGELGNEFVFDVERMGQVLYLDDSGVTRWVEISNESNFDFTDGVTITAWMKAGPQNTDWVNIITKFDAYNITRHWNTDYIGAGVTGVASAINWTMAFDNQWHFIAMSYDAELGKSCTFLDYTVNSESVEPVAMTLSDCPLRIGGNSITSMVGYLDDVCVYNYAMSPQEILTNVYDLAKYDIGMMDRKIDLLDFFEMALQWGCTGKGYSADVNGDEVVDIKDLAEFSEFWLN